MCVYDSDNVLLSAAQLKKLHNKSKYSKISRESLRLKYNEKKVNFRVSRNSNKIFKTRYVSPNEYLCTTNSARID